MKPFSLPIVAAIIVFALFVSSVHAQSPGVASKRPTPSAKTNRRITPAPPIVVGSKYRATGKKPLLLGEPDPSGRRDLGGNPVPFYPVSRGNKAVQNSASPIREGKRQTTAPPPRANQ
jgi:hypothetical protein